MLETSHGRFLSTVRPNFFSRQERFSDSLLCRSPGRHSNPIFMDEISICRLSVRRPLLPRRVGRNRQPSMARNKDFPFRRLTCGPLLFRARTSPPFPTSSFTTPHEDLRPLSPWIFGLQQDYDGFLTLKMSRKYARGLHWIY